MTIVQTESPTSAPQALPLQARGLGKSYGPHTALHDLDLDLAAGQRLVLLGPNGAGKSTLLQILSGLYAPDRGQVHVMGWDMGTHAPQALARLGVVFQQAALDLDLSVQANLLFHADLHGLPRAQALARMVQDLQAMGLSEVAHRTCRSLSGGTRRKVELLRALLHRPAVLLMDEATVGLDAASRTQMLQTVEDMQRQRGVATLWATHLADEVVGADHVLVIHRGRALFRGTPQAFLAATGQLDFQSALLHMLKLQGPADRD